MTPAPRPRRSPGPRRPSRPTRLPALAAALALGVLGALALSACATSSAAGEEEGAGRGGGKVIRVVAAENFWGSIASQLGGRHVQVTSIIANPNADPHDYEPTAADARAVAAARYTIVNGAGYDAWAARLTAAAPGAGHGAGRASLDVGDLVGVAPGGNPHRWYSPADVHAVIERITADYKKLDPAGAADFDALKAAYETKALAPYENLIAGIKARYGGTPVGASESIVSPLAEGLGLKVLTPDSFLSAISEGSDPTAHDKAAADRQITARRIKVYLWNSQNATPDVQRQTDEARAAGIPVVTVTETLTPAGASFQDWQVRQLRGLASALARATGK